MDLQQLKTFVILAQYENMPITAEILETSQPQVSKILSSLETELNVKLFDRVGRGIRLNEHGTAFLRYANDAIASMTDGKNAMQQTRDATLGTITIGCMAFANVLSPSVRSYARKNPHTNFRYITPLAGNRDELKKIDILISPSVHGQHNFKSFFPVSRVYLEEHYHIICSPRFAPFPEDKKSLSYEEYRNYPFIVAGSRSPSMLVNDFSVLDTISNNLGAAPPRIAFQANELDLKMQLVGECLGMSLLPDSCLPIARRLVPGLRVFDIEDCHVSRTVVVARPRRSTLSSVALDFWDFILMSCHMEPDTSK